MNAHNQEQYNRFADAYHAKRGREEDSIWNRYLDRPMIETLLADLPARQRMLDFGCGSGLLSSWMAEQGHQVSGVDFSSELIMIARQENPDLEFAVADIQQTPFADGAFDLLVSGLVLHYIQDLKPVFAEAARLLAPGGRFIFTMHHPVDEVTSANWNSTKIATMQPYFHNNEYRFRMAGMELMGYHHTFENISDAQFANGFVIERILEGRFSGSVKDRYPKDYERTNTYPSFIGFRVRRGAPGD